MLEPTIREVYHEGYRKLREEAIEVVRGYENVGGICLHQQ